LNRTTITHAVGELFSGAGGLGLAARRARVEDPLGRRHLCRTVWANDYNKWACKSYHSNLGGHVINGPVQEIDFDQLAPIDGLMFGFPCNDYSVVGKQKGLEGEFGPLYSYGVKALNAKRPRWFLAENVSGLTSANEGDAFRRILEDLRAAGSGYELTTHLYRFEQYGVPQTRHRVIVVGIRSDLIGTPIEGTDRRIEPFAVPRPTHAEQPITASEALRGVENALHNNERINHSDKVIEFLSHIPPGGNAWSPEVPEVLRLNVAGARLSHIYKRLHPDRPAHTVTARGGGGTRGYHWEEPRALTNRELARIQTFPDDFVFQGPTDEVRSQIGMAVPPLGAQVIVEAILKGLHGIEYGAIATSTPQFQLQFNLSQEDDEEESGEF
jgi:DNA (cytosine-5)-methyltransferase 1